MPVSSFGPRPPASIGLVETWCQMCSSTPRAVTSCEPRLVGGHRLQQRTDRAPHGAPGWSPAAGRSRPSRRARGAAARPPTSRPHAQQRPRPARASGLLGERLHRGTRPRRSASVACATPAVPVVRSRACRSARHVPAAGLPTTTPHARQPIGPRTPTRPPTRSRPALLGHLDDVEPVQADEQIAARAVQRNRAAARSNARRRLDPFPVNSPPRVAHTPTAGTKSRFAAVAAAPATGCSVQIVSARPNNWRPARSGVPACQLPAVVNASASRSAMAPRSSSSPAAIAMTNSYASSFVIVSR